MADEIRQQLGFDASQALDTLKQLDGALATLQSRLQSSGSSFDSFNKDAGRTVSALIQLARNGQAAADALSAVSKAGGLGRNVAQDATAAATAAASVAAQLQATGESARTASVRVGDASIRIGQASKQAAADVQSSTSRMTTSFALLSRIVFTQTIVRALSQLRNLFRNTASEAIAFQKSLALVTTIDDSGQSIGQLGNAVRSISDQFNIPLLQTSAGLYQTISNQVGNAAESLTFLGEAAKFARATNSTLEESVDLLSGALKAFHLNIDQTGKVSSSFFKAIDLGRITAKQLANAFGQIGPLAAQAGLSLDELNGAVAAISVQGSKAPQAITQLRGVLTATIKPTVAFKQVLKDMGFESFEAAKKTLGFANALNVIAKSAKGSPEAMGKLFTNVRGLSGEAALTADDVKTLTDDIEKMTAAGSKFTDSKFLQATATDAEKVTSDINRLKNSLTVDLGQALLKVVAELSDAVGGVENFTTVIKSSGRFVLEGAAALVLLAAKFKIASLAGAGFLSSLANLALLPLAVKAAGEAIGSLIGNMVDNAIFEKNFKTLFDLEKKNATALKELTDKLTKEADEQKATDDKRVQSVRQATTQMSADYLKQKDAATSANDSLVKSTKDSIDKIVTAYAQLSAAEDKTIHKSFEIERASNSRITSLQDKIRDLNFENQTRNADPSQKIALLEKSARDIASQASQTLATAGEDQTKIARGLTLFGEAQQKAEAAMSLAQSKGNESDVLRARQQIKQVVEDQISAEQRLGRAQAANRVALTNERNQRTKDLAQKVRAQGDIVKSNTGNLDANKLPFSDAEQTARDQKRVAALAEIVRLSKEIKPADLAKLGLRDFIEKAQNALTQEPLRLQFTIERDSAKIKQQLTDSFTTFKVKFQAETGLDVSQLEKTLGKQFQSPEQVFKGLEEASTKADEIRRKLNGIEIGGQSQQSLRAEMTDLFNKIDSFDKARHTFGGEQADQANAAFERVKAILTQVASQSTITSKDIDTAGTAVKQFNEAFQDSGPTTKLAFNSSTNALNLLLQKIIQINAEQTKQGASPQAEQLKTQLQSLDALQGKLQGGGAAGLGQQLTDAGSALSTGANALSTATGPAATIREAGLVAGNALIAGAQAWERASTASFNTPSPTTGYHGIIKAFAKGGFANYFAAGGFARGVDQIPIMAAKGESIINARSSQRFFSQLQAMNAGQNPNFRAAGGPVTNVGDVNVNIKTSDPSQIDGRKLGRELRREMRRGNLRFPR